MVDPHFSSSTVTSDREAESTSSSDRDAHDGAVAPEPDGADSPADEGVERSAGTPAPASREPSSESAGPAAPASSSSRPPRRPRDPALARAYRTRRPVRGKVERAIKGGFEVRVGKSRGFCPFSQIDLHRVEDPEAWVGQSLLFSILQFRRGGEDVVLSRRSILEEQRSEEAKAVRATLIEGAVMLGKVSSVAPFGAFVDLGAGVTGLAHVSELSHARTAEPTAVVKPGDSVRVRVLKLDDRRGRISLSLRQAEEDPWLRFAERFSVGEVYPGTISRITDFGAFVELAPGIEVLAHSRDFPPTPDGWNRGLEPGQTGHWLLLSAEPDRRRASVVAAAEDGPVPKPVRPEPGATLEGRVHKVEKFGVLVWLGPGAVGLVPNAWTGTARGTDLRRSFPVGRTVEVDVVEVDDDGRRIRLAVKGANREPLAPAERAPRRDRRRADRPPAEAVKGKVSEGSFGTSLADALRAALDKPEDRA